MMDVGALTGQRLGGFLLDDKLGAGGFGAVYRARLMVRGETMS